MRFHSLECSTDGDLELVAPAARYIDELLISSAHPDCASEPVATWSAHNLLEFVQQSPGGIDEGNPLTGRWPAYIFWMRVDPQHRPAIPIVGTCSLRLGHDAQLRLFTGHVGYGVFPPARGHRYAERATRLMLPLARRHGYGSIWITVNPDNVHSRKTIERLGGELVEIIDIPEGNPARDSGATQKCRYRVDL